MELRTDREVVLVAVAQNGRALGHAPVELRTTGRAALLADAAKLRAGGRLVAALQRLAFAACFADASHFALAGGGPSSNCELAACLANMPTDLVEVVHRSPVVHELPGLELICRASEQGWAWRSAAAQLQAGFKRLCSKFHSSSKEYLSNIPYFIAQFLNS